MAKCLTISGMVDEDGRWTSVYAAAMNTRRLLVSAYGCEPSKGSEQGVGWNWVLQLARLAELIVVTRANNRDAIEAALPEDLIGRIRFVYYDLPEHLRSFKRRERGLYLYYLLWQWTAYRVMQREIMREPVDYAMHLTFGSVWMPTFMHRLPVPFIWGPVGGGEAVPWLLIPTLPPKSRVMQYARYLLMTSFAFNPLVTGVTRKARVILARTGDTAKLFCPSHVAKTRVMLETAASEDWFERGRRKSQTRSGEPLQVIFTGRLVAFKNLNLAIGAVAAARRRGANIHFTLVGNGPLREALVRQVDAEGISDAVTFAGHCTQTEVLNRLAVSDVYLFPSLREGGPWSLMEAMAVGLPSICVNTSGMAVIADPSCARLIDVCKRAQMIDSFADALCELASNPDLRRDMGENARQRLKKDFRWEQKAAFMETLFEDLDRGLL